MNARVGIVAIHATGVAWRPTTWSTILLSDADHTDGFQTKSAPCVPPHQSSVCGVLEIVNCNGPGGVPRERTANIETSRSTRRSRSRTFSTRRYEVASATTGLL
jgi:hypothetical protein